MVKKKGIIYITSSIAFTSPWAGRDIEGKFIFLSGVATVWRKG